MNSRERFLAALHGERPDRTPLAHVAALTTVELQQATGCHFPGAHLDADQHVRLLAANHDVLGFDAVTFLTNYFNEPAALGVEIDWGTPESLPVYRSHPWQHAADAVIPADLLDREPISTCLRTLRIATRRHGRKMAVLGKVMGPFSMAMVMHGPEPTMIAMIDAPGKIAHFMEVCVEAIVRYANAQFDEGIDALVIGEGGAGAAMLSPAMYGEFLLPLHHRLIRRIDGPTIMHICGDITPRLNMLAQTGMTCFNFDWEIRPELMVAAAAGKFTVMGNVNTTDLLNADPREIERQVVENLAAGVHIISPGCAVSPKCPNANLRAMADAIGRY